MSLILTIREANEVTIVSPNGRLTLGEGTNAFREKIRQLGVAGCKRVLIDLAGVTYMDSTAVGELADAHATLTNAGGEVKLLNLGQRVFDLLMTTKLYTIFDIYDDEPSAIASFAGSGRNSHFSLGRVVLSDAARAGR